ncbi:MAG: glycine cleavage system protein H [archaeon]
MTHEFPDDLLYAKDFSWARIEGDVMTLGITPFAASRAMEIVMVDIPSVGTTLKKGDTFASIESMKWTGHLSSPGAGEVIERNDAVLDKPPMINDEPYAAWLCRIKLTGGTPEGLMDAEAAKEFYETQ